MSIPAYPLQWPEGWPRSRGRKAGQFGKTETKQYESGGSWRSKTDITIADAMKRVNYELERLGVNIVDDSIVSTNLKLNMSGRPRGDQGEPADPGVAVYFQKKNAPMRVIAIDAYHRVRDNLAAIAATLEAMRAIERHGGAQILERAFTGFAALTAPGKNWWDVLEVKPDASREAIEANFRRLAHDRHPDRGGSHDAMAVLNEARSAALRARP
jgi:hypothetical protein